MKSKFRSLPLQCAIVALVGQAFLDPSIASATTRARVSCQIPDLWNDRTPAVTRAVSAPTFSPRERVSSAPATSWAIQYKGTGADRLRGVARERVLRHGVLWIVDPASLGVSVERAARALLQAGAVIARAEGDGRVYFRARKENAERVASRAAELLGATSRMAPSAMSASFANAYDSSGATTPYRAAAGEYSGLTKLEFDTGVIADVAMLRVEGRMSRTPISFIEQLPIGMTVYSFGTGFVVHVPPHGTQAIKEFLEDEGNSVLLVGASAGLEAGREAARAIRYCGGNFLADRFPTPIVETTGRASAIINVEGQRMQVSAGDTVLVIQQPLYGIGLEIALMRFK